MKTILAHAGHAPVKGAHHDRNKLRPHQKTTANKAEGRVFAKTGGNAQI
jgi:hypothetical protein